MPGPAPKKPAQRRRRNKPVSGEWKVTPGLGWQHGPIPEPPDGLLEASRKAWAIWMGAWFASHWTPDDLPGLRKVIFLYDATERGDLTRSSELRQHMDGYGITPKGQQALHWAWQAPKVEGGRPPVVAPAPAVEPAASRYGHLRAVGTTGS